MYAIVDIAGQQLKVSKDQKLFVHRLEGEAGSKVTFDKVLLIDNDSKLTVGNPTISGAAISATVIEHLKGDKVLVFKKKRRKGYKKLNGHRQYLTRIQITDIAEKGVAKKTATKAEKPAAAKAKADKPAAKAKADKPAAAKATATKVATEKPATKKTTTAVKKTTTAKAKEVKPAAAKAKTDKPAAAKKATATKKTTAKAKPAATKAADKKATDKE